MSKVRTIIFTNLHDHDASSTLAVIDENTKHIPTIHAELKRMSDDEFRYILGGEITKDEYKVLTSEYDPDDGWDEWRYSAYVNISDPMEIVK